MCEFINESNCKCSGKIKYGNFCSKHKRNHLIQNDYILIERFTGKSSDYLKKDIINTLNYLDKKKYNSSLKKDILFKILSEKYKKFNHYTKNSTNLIKIQYIVYKVVQIYIYCLYIIIEYTHTQRETNISKNKRE